MPSQTPTFSSPAPPLLAALQHLAACSEIAGDQSRLLVQKVVDAIYKAADDGKEIRF
jgi:hypothetical protein